MALERASLFTALSLTTLAALSACGSDSSGSAPSETPDASFVPPTPPTPPGTPPAPPPPPPADAGSEAGSGRSYSGPSGVLDTTFGGTGFVTKVGAAGGTSDLAHGVAIDSKDRIVAVGSSQDAMGFSMVAAWRVTVAGAFDSTFGTNGAWFSANTLGGNKYAEGWSVVVDDQDRPVLSGQANNGSPIYAAIWRLTTGGVPDTTWNGTGVVGQTNTGGGQYDLGSVIRRDKNGKYVVAGFTDAPALAMNSATWRFTSSGTLDTAGFASPDGYVTASATLGSSPSSQSLSAVAFDTNDDVIVAGGGKDSQSTYKGLVFKYSGAGVLDTTFGTQGHAVVAGVAGGMPPVASDGINAIAVDSQHRIIVCGVSNTLGNAQRGFVGRLTSAGAPDATFGTNGFVVFDPASGNTRSNVRACALDAQGRIVAVGGSSLGNSQPNRVMAWRVTTSGALDTTFGTQGVFAKTGTAGGTDDFGWSVAIDSAGCPVIAGQSKDGTGNLATAVWRLTP